MSLAARGENAPLRIIHVTPTYAPCVGGAERMLQAVSERLAARGHEVTVFTINGITQPEVMTVTGGTLPPTEVINGVRVRRFAPEDWSARAFRAASNLPGGWRVASAIIGEGVGMVRRRPGPLGMIPALLRARPDVVTTVNWVWAPAYAGHLARRVRKFGLLGVPILHIARPWADNPAFRPMLEQCDAVIALTEAEAEFAGARGARQIVVTGVGIDPRLFQGVTDSLRAHLGGGNDPIVGFVGRQDRFKGAVTLIDAMRLVWQSAPATRLLLAGQAAHRSIDVDHALAGLPQDQRARVILLDDFTDEEATSIAGACDIVAVPSVEEAFGIVYLEAWMCGKPVVGARIPSTSCVISEGVDGMLAEPLDPEDLSRCLLVLLANPALRERMGKAGREKTLAHFTWDTVTDRWEAALRRAI